MSEILGAAFQPAGASDHPALTEADTRPAEPVDNLNQRTVRAPY
jgi:hypothetical protein